MNGKISIFMIGIERKNVHTLPKAPSTNILPKFNLFPQKRKKSKFAWNHKRSQIAKPVLRINKGEHTMQISNYITKLY